MLEVLLSYAVGNPSTVVVHTHDAPATRATMMRPRWLRTLTVVAEGHKLVFEIFDLIVRQIESARCR